MPTDAVTLEVGGREVRLSSPGKIYFPAAGITKLDLAHYFLAVAEGALAGVVGRPTTMERWPGGLADSEPFYQKRLPQSAPDWVGRCQVRFPSGRPAEAVCPDDLATLIWMLNLGSFRFHPWPVRGSAPDLVDELRIDLDPQPGTGFAHAARAALVLREVLADADLTGVPKTSGGRGVHVYVRVDPVDFIDARHAAIALGRELARRMPDQVTTHWWKEERGQRVFVDYNQMARDRLMASPYSVRPVPEATVSAPLTWQELPDASPADFTVATMPGIVAGRGDAWREWRTSPPLSLATALAWWERDLEAGEGELPYPPEYPKMPGEPSRVQPSRAKRD